MKYLKYQYDENASPKAQNYFVRDNCFLLTFFLIDFS